MRFHRLSQSRGPAGRSPLAVVLCAVACALAVGAVRAQEGAAQEVHVGLGLPKPPYIMESGAAGYDYDIAKQALAAAGYKLVGQSLPQSRGLAMLRAGHLDGLLSITEGIGGQDYFTDNYIVYQNVATTLSSRNLELKQIEDLANYSVAAFQNASMLLGERYGKVVANHPRYKEFPAQITQDKLLYMGRVDVVVGDHLIFRYFSDKLEQHIDARQALTFHRIFPESPRKAVFRDLRVRDAFNAGLRIIRANGTYDAIAKQYLGSARP